MKMFILFIFVLLAELAFSSEFNNAQKQYLGAENILKNPGFENGKTAWTLTNGTLATESIIKIAGSKSLKANLSSQALELYQDSSLYASQFNGSVQGLGYIRIKTQVTGLKVCARKAGVIQTSLCIDVQANNEWGLYKIPFILGGTSNGLAVTSNGVSFTGDVYLDDAFVGAVDLAASVDQSTLVGGVVISGCQYTTTSTSFADLNNSGACVYTPFGQALAPSTNIPGVRFLTLDAGEYRIEYTGALHALRTGGSGSAVGFRISDGTNVSRENAYIGAATAGDNASSTIPTASWTIKYNSTQTAPTLKIQGYTTSATSSTAAINSSYAIGTVPGVIKVYRVAQGNTYTSKNADTDYISYTPTFGAATVTASEVKYYRKGGFLYGSFSVSTSSHSVASLYFTLPNGLSIDTGKLVNNLPIGKMGSTNTPFDGVVAAYDTQPTRIYLCRDNVSISSCNVATDWAAPNVFTGEFKVPIEGWENSNIIIGQFNGLESCSTDSYECTDTFSAKVSSTGVVSDENIDWINGNCTVASTASYTCNFKANIFTVAPNCTMTSRSGGASAVRHLVQSTSSFVNPYGFNTSTGAALASNFEIICQKQGADYIGKTAKAVASDQNVRSIGAVGVDIQSVYFGSGADCSAVCTTGNCTICSQIGSKITSVSWATTGQYNLNGIDGTKYVCSGTGVGNQQYPLTHRRSLSTSTYARIILGLGIVENSGNASVTCIGIP